MLNKRNFPPSIAAQNQNAAGAPRGLRGPAGSSTGRPLPPLLLLLALTLAGCVSPGAPPPALRYTPYTNLPYGPHERNTLDLSLPQGRSPQGVILFIHGGVWMYGDKESVPLFLDPFRDRFIVASMNHRYIDETTHISDLEADVAAAVAAVRDFAADRGVEPGKLIPMGHSSGAHLALLYAYKAAGAGALPLPLAFCVDMAGPADLGDLAFPYNFKKLGWEKLFYSLAEKAAGYQMVDGDVTPEGYSERGRRILTALSPITFAGPQSPPTIMVHDVADEVVPYANSAALHSVLGVYGVDHAFLALSSGVGHFLGAKAVKGGGVRYDRALELWLVRTMNEYIEKYCQ